MCFVCCTRKRNTSVVDDSDDYNDNGQGSNYDQKLQKKWYLPTSHLTPVFPEGQDKQRKYGNVLISIQFVEWIHGLSRQNFFSKTNKTIS